MPNALPELLRYASGLDIGITLLVAQQVTNDYSSGWTEAEREVVGKEALGTVRLVKEFGD